MSFSLDDSCILLFSVFAFFMLLGNIIALQDEVVNPLSPQIAKGMKGIFPFQLDQNLS